MLMDTHSAPEDGFEVGECVETPVARVNAPNSPSDETLRGYEQDTSSPS
jgi:hypothetical protein